MLLEWPIGSATVRLGISADEPVHIIGVDPPDADCGAGRPAATPLVEWDWTRQPPRRLA